MPEQFSHGYALLVGVGAALFQPWSLPVTVRDAQAMQACLLDPSLCAYPADEGHVRLLHDDAATRRAVLDGLVRADGVAELLAHLDVLERQREQPLHQADGLGALRQHGQRHRTRVQE